ncbi:MAG TPA: OFA family MFS transporter [Pirellulales bacterium]|jgi:OFA family oxalate/formate antiporter-like MFS transporter
MPADVNENDLVVAGPLAGELMQYRRWLVLLGALLMQPCLGAIYGWGVFVPALKASRSELTVTLSPQVLEVDPAQHAELVGEYKALKKQLAEAHADDRAAAKADVERFLADVVPARVQVAKEVWAKQCYGYSGTQAQAVFSTGIMVFALVMILAGRWQDRVGPRIVAFTGGLVLAAGYALAALAGPSFPMVLLGVGVIGGAGIGMGYVCPIAACVKWFPDLRGLVTGLAVAGFGGGAFLFIKLAGNWGGLLAAEGVSATLLTYAAIFVVFVSLGASLLRNPPVGWQPSGWTPPAAYSQGVSTAVPDFEQADTVRTRSFWMLWLAFMFASSCGMMVIGSLKDFGIREGRLSDFEAEGALALLAVFNALGRITWGWVSQRFGARQTLVLISFLQAAMVVALIEMGTKVWTLEVAACWVGFHFGGNLALFPLLTAEYFGTRHLGANYGLMFTGYGVGGVVGPMLAGSVWDTLGSYRWAYLPAAAGCLFAMALALTVRPPKPAQQTSATH